MPAISAGDLTKLRSEDQTTNLHLTVCPAQDIWSARVNDGSIATGDRAIAFDGGSGAAWSAVGELQEVWVGTTAGAYDKGRVRIRSATSGDSGVTGTVNVSSNSVPWSDNDYLTFICWYLPKPRRPRLDSNGVFYKDYDITYSDQNEEPPPVCIAGENRAGFLAPAAVNFAIDLTSSYAVANGATISSYSATAIYPTSGITINPVAGVGVVQITSPGTYWVKFTVTDSNGKSQSTYRHFTAHSSSRGSANYPHIDFTANNLNGSWNDGGWKASISAFDNADLDDIPDFAPVIIWQESYYQGSENYITFLPDDSNTVLNGYIRKDRFNQALLNGVDTVDIELSTIHDVFRNQFNYSVSLEAKNSVSFWYQYDTSLTPGRAVHHLLRWHSTLMEVADVIGLTTDTRKIAFAEFDEGTVFGMADTFLRDRSIRHRLICDKGGRLHMVPDVQLLDDTARGALTITADIENTNNADKSGDVDIIRQQERRTPFVFVSGFSWDGTFDSDGVPNATPICASAPGQWPADDGASPANLGRQTWTNSAEAAAVAGRVFATKNNLYPEMRVTFAGNYIGVLEPYLSEFWTMSQLATENARGIIWTAKNLLLRNVSIQFGYEQNRFNGVVSCSLTFEPEADGYTGAVTDCPSYPTLEGADPPVPVDEEAGGGLITGSSVYRLPAQSLTWSLETAEATNDLIIDPFWQSRQSSVASDDAIVWRCGTGYIKRSTDGGQAWTAVTPSTDPPNDAGDGSPLTAGTVDYVWLNADYSTQGKFIALARGQTGGEWRTWYVVTADDGTTWDWTSVTVGSGSGFGNPTIGQENDFATNRGSIAWLDDSTIIVNYVNGTDISAKVGSVSGDVITWGSAQTSTRSTGDVATVGNVFRLSDTTFVSVFEITDGENFDFYCACGTISGTSVTWGTTDTLLDVDTVAACRLTNTSIAIAREFNDDFVIGSISGSGTNLAVSLNTPTSAPAGLFGSVRGITALSSTAFVAVSINGGEARVIACTVSGTTITAGTIVGNVEGVVTAAGADIVALSSTSFVAVMSIAGTAVRANVCTVSGTTITLGTATQIQTATSITASELSVAFVSSTEFAIVFMDGSTVTVNTYDTSYNANSETTTTGAASNSVKIDSSPTSQNLAINYIDTGSNGTASVITGSGAQTYQLKGQGIDIDKVGLYYYMTFWVTGDTLELLVIDESDDSIVAQTSLGSATLAQVDAKTYSSFPYTPLDFSVDCYLFGRMNTPSGLSSNEHVITVDSSDGSLTSVISAWSTDYAGAMIDDGETAWIARCDGTNVQLYNGSGTVLSTMPFTSQAVNPHGLTYDYLQTTIYAAADTGASVMVVKSTSPFSTWIDITYAHGTSGGVKAIELL